MSHLNSVATKLTNKETLLSVLRKQPEVRAVYDKSLNPEEAYVRYYNDQQGAVDIAARLGGRYDLGFIYNPGEGSYQAVADFSMAECPAGDGDKQASQDLRTLWIRIVANYVADEAFKSGQLSKDNVTVRLQG